VFAVVAAVPYRAPARGKSILLLLPALAMAAAAMAVYKPS
jgi:hypothetical protein